MKYVIPNETVERLRLLYDEAKRYRLLLSVITDSIYSTIQQETGIDTRADNCELDLDRGILECGESADRLGGEPSPVRHPTQERKEEECNSDSTVDTAWKGTEILADLLQQFPLLSGQEQRG